MDSLQWTIVDPTGTGTTSQCDIFSPINDKIIKKNKIIIKKKK